MRFKEYPWIAAQKASKTARAHDVAAAGSTADGGACVPGLGAVDRLAALHAQPAAAIREVTSSPSTGPAGDHGGEGTAIEPSWWRLRPMMAGHRHRRMKVRANAETPPTAEPRPVRCVGRGLVPHSTCSSREKAHLGGAPARMIAEDEAGRGPRGQAALEQRADCKAISQSGPACGDHRPSTPCTSSAAPDEEFAGLADTLGIAPTPGRRAAELNAFKHSSAIAAAHRDHISRDLRGCRRGRSSRQRARLAGRAARCRDMIPLVATRRSRLMRELVDRVGAESREKGPHARYQVGT